MCTIITSEMKAIGIFRNHAEYNVVLGWVFEVLHWQFNNTKVTTKKYDSAAGDFKPLLGNKFKKWNVEFIFRSNLTESNVKI